MRSRVTNERCVVAAVISPRRKPHALQASKSAAIPSAIQQRIFTGSGRSGNPATTQSCGQPRCDTVLL